MFLILTPKTQQSEESRCLKTPRKTCDYVCRALKRSRLQRIAPPYTSTLYISQACWGEAAVSGSLYHNMVLLQCQEMMLPCWFHEDRVLWCLFILFRAGSSPGCRLRQLLGPFKAHGYLRLLNPPVSLKVSVFFCSLDYLLVYSLQIAAAGMF